MMRDCPMDVCMRNLQQKVEWGKKTGKDSRVPGSHKHLALRNCMICARNMGAHVGCSTSESQRYKKMVQEIGFPHSQEKHKETSK
jgi:hypothetical protein